MGKLIGGLLGMILAPGPIGLLLGVFIGHQFDKGLAEQRKRYRPSANPDAARRAFFETTFSVMGHVAKADGRVSEEEIRQARSIMYGMRLSPELTREAMRLFTDGKREDFPLESTLEHFRTQTGGDHDLFRTFMLIQIQAAMADGVMGAGERGLLWRMCQVLGVSRVELAQLEAMVHAQKVFGAGGGAGAGASQPGRPLEEAYKVLGVEPGASDAEVKKAYRRLMSQHHPDKLLARGLPESMRGEAEVRTQEIRAAYDEVKKARGLR